MIFGSVCSGIEAASVAWHPLGWRAAFLSEIEAFPRAVLQHHYPEVPLHGDFTTIEAGQYEPIDLLVGGTPCQSFSVAGLRGGLADDRGNLALEYLRLADRLRPRWLVWENVPGVLSSAGGRDFGAILGGMVELGYGFAYRVLDAQFFGVAQRRRRVFVVGYLGDWRRAAAVLFERHSLQGHPAPRRVTREGTAYSPGYGPERNRERAGRPEEGRATAQAYGGGQDCNPTDVSTAIIAHPGGRYSLETETFVAQVAGTLGHNRKAAGSATNQDAESGLAIAFSSKDHGADAEHDLAPTLRADGHDGSHANAGVPPAIAFALRGREGGAMPEVGGDQIGSLRAASGGSSRDYVAIGSPHADAAQTGPREALLALRDAIGAEALCEWQAGVLASLHASEVLQSAMRGIGAGAEAGRGLGDGPLARSQRVPAGPMRKVWEAGRQRRAPRGRGLSEQLARQLDEALSELSHQGAPAPWILRDLRRAGEGPGLLQQALHPIQGRSAVRRLTLRECERLQGFPDDYTLIPWRKGVAPDGPRYKALGNSMAVPVMRWIGERIAMVDALQAQRAAA